MALRKITKSQINISCKNISGSVQSRHTRHSEQAGDSEQAVMRGRPPESRNLGVRAKLCSLYCGELSLAPPEQHKRAHVHRFFWYKRDSSSLIFLVSSFFR